MKEVYGEDIDLYVTNETRPKILSRFTVKFEVRDSGCWEWTAKLDDWGYGRMHIGTRRQKQDALAHRLSFLLFKGPVRRMYVLHKCDNPRCVNPDHLYLGTQADNISDQINRGRRASFVGEAHPRARLTTSDVIEIRASGERARDIAKRYGVCRSTILQIRSRAKWGHVP